MRNETTRGLRRLTLPQPKVGGGERFALLFSILPTGFFFCQLALTEAAAETSGIVFWQRDRVHHINPG